MKQQQKHAVITGATSGIAISLSKMLLEDGYDVSLMLKTNSKRTFLINKLGKWFHKDHVKMYECDVADTAQIKQTLAQILKQNPQIDALVTMAGMSHGKKLEEDTEETFNEEIAVNLRGTYMCILESYLHMKKGSAIVTIASSRARTGTPRTSVGYAAAKAGVINLTKSCALQLAKYGIRVNSVSPYYVHPSPFTAKYTDEQLQKIADGVPLKKLSTYEDIAHAIFFLLSDNVSNITGHTLDVDGGVWMN